MKSAVSEVWLLGLVILFIMSFTGFLAVTISYSRAFKMNDMMLTKIENYKGVTNHEPDPAGSGKYKNPGTLQSINAYLVASGYKIKGKCPKSDSTAHWIGINDLNYTERVNLIEDQPKNTKVYYCISKYKASYYGGSSTKSYTYKVRLFFKLELPVLGDIFTFDVDGETYTITNGVNDDTLLPPV